jgi:3-dehydroquinate synthase
MRRDKKVRDGRVSFVLVRGIGKAFMAGDIALDDVAALLTDQLAA